MHVTKLREYAQRLETLGDLFPVEIGTDIILKSLPPSFTRFFMNFNMHGINKIMSEFFAMLKVVEKHINKNVKHAMMVDKTTQFKKKAWNKRKGSSKDAGEAHTPMKSKVPKPRPKADARCFFYKEKGHWKMNYPKYLAEKLKKIGTSSLSIFDIHVIHVLLSGPQSNYWLFGTGSVANICNLIQELWKPRMLEKNEVTMCIENGARVLVVPVGIMPLHIPSGLN
jgi:hypothetical protein